MAKKTKTPASVFANALSNSEVMRSVASSIEFIKSLIANDLMLAKNSKLIDLDNDQLKIIGKFITLQFLPLRCVWVVKLG